MLLEGLFISFEGLFLSIGEGVVAKAISALKEQGIDKVFLNLFENNQPAIKLYQKLGFKRADVPEIEKKINEHYAIVAPGSAQSLVLCKELSQI